MLTRPHEPFDPKHPRCKYPLFGAQFNQVLEASGMSCQDVATKVGIAVENVYGYRRGFSHPTDTTRAKLAKVFNRPLATEFGLKEIAAMNEEFDELEARKQAEAVIPLSATRFERDGDDIVIRIPVKELAALLA
jgi:transcriptional regulator with XRE-family HTH domain